VIIKQYFGHCTTTDIKLRLHNITPKTALFYGREPGPNTRQCPNNGSSTGTYNSGSSKKL
jgi:hypothetical protein